MSKVKAHRNQADVAEADLYDWQGNEFADQWSKLGSTDRHEKDADAAAELLTLNLRKSRRVVMWLANQEWPDAKDLGQIDRGHRPEEVRRSVRRNGHTWTWQDPKWQCSTCGRLAKFKHNGKCD